MELPLLFTHMAEITCPYGTMPLKGVSCQPGIWRLNLTLRGIIFFSSGNIQLTYNVTGVVCNFFPPMSAGS